MLVQMLYYCLDVVHFANIYTHTHTQNIATAALFLAAKVEEQPRKLEYVARVSYSIQNRDTPNLDTQSEVSFKLSSVVYVFINCLI